MSDEPVQPAGGDSDLISMDADHANLSVSRWIRVGEHDVRLLRDGAAAYPAMLTAIAKATSEICLEMYWFGSDSIGKTFVDALADSARRGVQVMVIYDAFGSSADKSLFDPLRQAGGEILIFRPFTSLFQLGEFIRRDHRKMLIVDRVVGFTGGLNLGMPWAPIAEGGEGWRDDMAEVHGPAADELRSVFFENYRRLLGRRSRRKSQAAEQLRQLSQARDSIPPVSQRPLPEKVREDVWAIATSHDRKRPRARTIRATYLRWIRGATTRIDITSAYFVPDFAIRRALMKAAERGVQVRVMVPKRGDLWLIQLAVEATLEGLVRKGISIFAYRHAVLHAKTAVIDDWVTIGSYNLDATSYLRNHEINLAVASPEFAAVVRQAFEFDARDSEIWTYEDLRNRGFIRRILGLFVLLFSRFL